MWLQFPAKIPQHALLFYVAHLESHSECVQVCEPLALRLVHGGVPLRNITISFYSQETTYELNIRFKEVDLF